MEGKDYIFVYGLFRDQSKKMLGETIWCGKASIDGKLYKVDEFYPGYVPGEGKVWGDVLIFDTKLFPQMDEYEGSEYKRVRVKTSSDIECWVYQYIDDITNCPQITSGDWYLR